MTYCSYVLPSFHWINIFIPYPIYLWSFSYCVITHFSVQLHTEKWTSSAYSRTSSSKWLVAGNQEQLQSQWNLPTHQIFLEVRQRERESACNVAYGKLQLCIVRGAAVDAIAPGPGLCCCFLLHCRGLCCLLLTTLDWFPRQPGCLHMESNQLL